MLQNPAKSHRCCASSPHHSPPLPSSLPRPTLPRANLCYARHRTSRCAAHLRHACHQPTSVTPAIHPTPIAFDPTLLAAAVLAAAVLIATVLAVAVPAPAVPVRRCRVCRLCAHVSTRSVALYDIQLNFTHILGIGPQNTRVFRMPAGPCGPDQRQTQRQR